MFSSHARQQGRRSDHTDRGQRRLVRLLLMLALGAALVCLQGCLINPVPTPGESASSPGAYSDVGVGDTSSVDWWQDAASDGYATVEDASAAKDAGGAATDAGATDTGSPWWDDVGTAEDVSWWEDDIYGGEDDAGAVEPGPDAGGGGPEPKTGPQSWQSKVDGKEFATVDVGSGQTLELAHMRVTVKVEGLRVRTLVDHIFKNPHNMALEGEFRYTLPAESSISYYAMFVGPDNGQTPAFFGEGDGLKKKSDEMVGVAGPEDVVKSADKLIWKNLREAKVVAKVAAKQAYEEETSKKIDPALVEKVAPNTFTAKVFPIPANGYNRVLIAYEETLTRIGKTPDAQLEYVFPVPAGDVGQFDFTLVALKKFIKGAKLVSDSVPDVKQSDLTTAWIAKKTLSGKGPGKALAFHFVPTEMGAEYDVLAGTDPVLKQSYALARLRPDIPGLKGNKAGSPLGIFLLDTSQSEHPQRFGISLKLLSGILKASPEMKQFNRVWIQH